MRNLKAEREALPEDRCPEIVNDWAWDERRRLCERPVSPEAVEAGHRLCGVHFRAVRRAAIKEAAEAIERKRQREERERAKIEQEVVETTSDAHLTELQRLGLENAFLEYMWRRRADDVVYVTVDARVLIQLLGGVLPPSPKEALERHVVEHVVEQHVNEGPAPF